MIYEIALSSAHFVAICIDPFVSLAAFLLFFPLVQSSVYQQAAESGNQVNYLPIFGFVFLILSVGLLIGLLVNVHYTNQHLTVLEDLTNAAKELGEGNFSRSRSLKIRDNYPK